MLITGIGGICVLSYLALVFRELAPRDRALTATLLAFFVAFGVLAARGFDPATFPPIPIRVMAIFLPALIISLFIPRLRAVWDAIPVERLVLWHWVRLPIGAIFVIAGAAGDLAPQFAHRAGWGDVLAGAWAVAFVLFPVLRAKGPALLWNFAGIADLLVAVVTAGLTIQSPFQRYPYAELMRPLLELPLVFVPAVAVPLLLFSHLLIFIRLRAGARR